MTQTSRILARLQMGQLCAMEPLDWEPRIYRVAARVNDLRNQGHEVITHKTCGMHQEPKHHAAYELVDQAQLRLI